MQRGKQWINKGTKCERSIQQRGNVEKERVFMLKIWQKKSYCAMNSAVLSGLSALIKPF